jgi:translation initiation factor 5B
MKIERAKVRGVESAGMLCSAYDIGWVSEPDGVLVQLPGSFKPGRACPDDPPEVHPLNTQFACVTRCRKRESRR